MPSDVDTSASGVSKAEEIFYLSECKKNKKQMSSDVPSSSCSCKSSNNSHFSDTNLNGDKMFKDTFALNIEVADLENGIQVKNLFTFDK